MKVIALGLLISSVVSKLHPVRQELIEEIKAKTNSWIPQELHENHLVSVPVELLQQKLGYLG